MRALVVLPVIASILILGTLGLSQNAYALSFNEGAKLTDSNAAQNNEFGYSVSISGDTAIVGTLYDTDTPSNSGSAYVFGSYVDVDIDIKPGSDPNSVNPKSMGVVPVAILGSASLDVFDVDVTTLAFGVSMAPAHDGHFEDVNNDGLLDLVIHFIQKETGIACGDTVTMLTGELFDGTQIAGTDSVSPVPCK